MQAFINFIVENKVVLLAALLAVSEALSLIPWVKANGVCQAIVNGIKKLYEMVSTPK